MKEFKLLNGYSIKYNDLILPDKEVEKLGRSLFDYLYKFLKQDDYFLLNVSTQKVEPEPLKNVTLSKEYIYDDEANIYNVNPFYKNVKGQIDAKISSDGEFHIKHFINSIDFPTCKNKLHAYYVEYEYEIFMNDIISLADLIKAGEKIKNILKVNFKERYFEIDLFLTNKGRINITPQGRIRKDENLYEIKVSYKK